MAQKVCGKKIAHRFGAVCEVARAWTIKTEQERLRRNTAEAERPQKILAELKI